MKISFPKKEEFAQLTKEQKFEVFEQFYQLRKRAIGELVDVTWMTGELEWLAETILDTVPIDDSIPEHVWELTEGDRDRW
ncbi:MAG TPA: hypothetical protein VFF14_01405 [Candidatus Deferrimicrobium sp.]|nr:hypothetical protein [Candidatus Deferrimicrobium sp.]